MMLYAELFETFEKQNIRYLVIGGIAVVLHGFLRATADLDLMIALDPENVDRFLHLMNKMGYIPRVPVALMDFASVEKRKQWITEKNMKVFALVHPKKLSHLLDVMVDEPISFDEVYARRERIPLKGFKVSVASKQDLIDLKKKVGRPQDQEDIEALERLKRKKDNG